MGRGILLWLLGVPIPVILLLAMCSHSGGGVDNGRPHRFATEVTPPSGPVAIGKHHLCGVLGRHLGGCRGGGCDLSLLLIGDGDWP